MKANKKMTTLLQPLRIDDLDFQKILGEGQFGQVWLARIHTKSQRTETTIAVKVLSKYKLIVEGGKNEAIHNLKREVDILNEIQEDDQPHPCLVQVINTMQDQNLIYIAQEFCGGGELFSLLQRKKMNNQAQQSHSELFYAACIIDALHHLHSRGIIYRDLKPENIVIRHTTGYPVLIDFGFAKHIESEANVNKRTRKNKNNEQRRSAHAKKHERHRSSISSAERRRSSISSVSSSCSTLSEQFCFDLADIGRNSVQDIAPPLCSSICSTTKLSTSLHGRTALTGPILMFLPSSSLVFYISWSIKGLTT